MTKRERQRERERDRERESDAERKDSKRAIKSTRKAILRIMSYKGRRELTLR